MDTDLVETILQAFFPAIVSKVLPDKVTPLIDGISCFEKDIVLSVTRKNGNTAGSKKMLDIIKKRTIPCFLSFLTALKQTNPDIADEMIHFIRKKHRLIYRRFNQFQMQHEKPLAIVRPTSQPTNSRRALTTVTDQLSVDSNEIPEPENVVITQTVETNSTPQIDRRASFSGDTLLSEIPNSIFVIWASALSREDLWTRIGDVLSFSRRLKRQISRSSNPGETFLDFISDEYDITVNGFISLLEDVQLTGIKDLVQQSLDPRRGFVEETTNLTSSSLNNELRDNSNESEPPSYEEDFMCLGNNMEDFSTAPEQQTVLNHENCIGNSYTNFNTAEEKYYNEKRLTGFFASSTKETENIQNEELITDSDNSLDTCAPSSELLLFSGEIEKNHHFVEEKSGYQESKELNSVDSENIFKELTHVKTITIPVNDHESGDWDQIMTKSRFQMDFNSEPTKSFYDSVEIVDKSELQRDFRTEPTISGRTKFVKSADQDVNALRHDLENQICSNSFKEIRKNMDVKKMKNIITCGIQKLDFDR